MEEKILIQSNRYNVKKIFKTLVLIGVAITAICLLFVVGDIVETWNDDFWGGKEYDRYHETYLEHQEQGYCYNKHEECFSCEQIRHNPSKYRYVIDHTFNLYMGQIFATIPFFAFLLISIISYYWLRSYELTVTDKRVYGTVAFGKRVDLPLDSISAISSAPLLRGVSVATSSGRIKFLIIKNANEIYKIINDLLIERQRKEKEVVSEIKIDKTDEAEQLKKFKDLLDNGIITQEEFDAKKKQMLGL